jgi:hypothetical protein
MPQPDFLKRATETNDQWLRRVGTVKVNKAGDFIETTKEAAMSMPQQDFLTTVVKTYGPTAIAKHVIDTPDTIITEFELTKALTDACEPAPGQSRAQAFAKLYETNQTVREAYATINNSPARALSYTKSEPLRKARDLEQGPQVSLMPVYTGGENGDRRGSSPGRTNSRPDIGRVGNSAIDQLDALVKEQLKARNLSTDFYSRVFAEIYVDPLNAALSEQERRENRPGGIGRMAT